MFCRELPPVITFSPAVTVPFTVTAATLTRLKLTRSSGTTAWRSTAGTLKVASITTVRGTYTWGTPVAVIQASFPQSR